MSGLHPSPLKFLGGSSLPNGLGTHGWALRALPEAAPDWSAFICIHTQLTTAQSRDSRDLKIQELPTICRDNSVSEVVDALKEIVRFAAA